MKRLTLVLLAAFSLPVVASINLNSSRSNVTDDADTAQKQGERLKKLDSRSTNKSIRIDKASPQLNAPIIDWGDGQSQRLQDHDRQLKSDKPLIQQQDKFLTVKPGTKQRGLDSDTPTLPQGTPTKDQRYIQGGTGADKFGSPTTVKGSKSNGDNRSIGDAVPDGCKPNEFCASGQHFPQPLKK
jgi:hypothetical protein